MSERQPATTEQDYELNNFIKDFESRKNSILGALKSWYLNKDSDSLLLQESRSSLFVSMQRELQELIWDIERVLNSHEIQFVVGEEPVTATLFSRSVYDMAQISHRELQPRTEMAVTMTAVKTMPEYLPDYPQPRQFYSGKTLFIGDYGYLVDMATLARSISQGGELNLVEKPILSEVDQS